MLAAIAVSGLLALASPPVKVLLWYDMEGVTAAAAPRDVQLGGPNYPATRESLTEDVNAAIRGLLRAGATEVVLTDGHGSGNAEPDYLLDRLPRGARFDIRDAPYDPFLEAIDGSYVAVVAVGMHSRAGGRGFLPHTYLGHTRWRMAGHDMNESMIVAASAGRFGVPLILVTGDDALRDEIVAFSPATAYVTVKKAVSADEAQPRPREEVSREIEEAAARAFTDRVRVKPWRPLGAGAFDNELGYLFKVMAALALNFPGARVVDDKAIGLGARDFVEAYQAFRALVFFTAEVRQRLVLDNVRKVTEGTDVMARAQALWPKRSERTFASTGTTIDAKGNARGKHGYR
jgi:D-amino peptidase